MLRILRSEQKNHSLMIAAFTGPAFAGLLLHFLGAPDHGIDYLTVIPALVLVGPVVGLLLSTLYSAILYQFMRGAAVLRIPWKSFAAMFAWSQVTIAGISLFVLPIGMSVFGERLFSNSYELFATRELEFWALTGISAILWLWSPVAFGSGIAWLSKSVRRAVFLSILLPLLQAATIFAAVLLLKEVLS